MGHLQRGKPDVLTLRTKVKGKQEKKMRSLGRVLEGFRKRNQREGEPIPQTLGLPAATGFLAVIYIMLQLSLPVGFPSQAETQHRRRTL